MMIKTIVYLFFVTQLCCLAQEDNNYKDEEVDITTSKSIEVKDNPKFDDKSGPEFEKKEESKDSPKDEYLPNPDYNDKEQLPEKPQDKSPDNYDTEIKSEKPVHNNPGTDPKDMDLGKDYKKVLIKPLNNNGKEFQKEDPNPNPYPNLDPNTNYGSGKEKDAGQDKKPNYSPGEDEYVPEKEVPEYKPPGSKNTHEKDVKNANDIMDSLLKLLKNDYRSDFEQIKLDDFEPFKHGRWGSVKLHSGVVTGLTNVERAGNVVVVDEYGNKKLIIGDIAVKDVFADYKMNAKLFNRISINDRQLKLWLKKAVLTVKLEADKNQKKLIVNELNLKTFEGLTAKSGRLFWPFNKLMNAIVKNQEHVIKDLIKKEFDKYMGKVVQTIQFDEMFAKLF